MKANQPLSRSHYTSKKRKDNPKGFVFSLDSILAIILFLSLVLAPSYYFFKGTKGFISSIEVNRVMYDTAKALDKKKTLQTLSKDIIETELTYLVPENYKYKAEIRCYEYSGSFIERDIITIDHNSDTLIQKVSGKYLFFTYTSGPQKELDKYCRIKWEAGI